MAAANISRFRLVSTLPESECARLAKASRKVRPSAPRRAELAELARQWRARAVGRAS
jgi:hypothetical protein